MAVQIQHHRDLGEFDYGTADQLSPLVRRVICQNPNPFTYKGTGTYIVGRGRVAVIDAGPPLDSHVDDIVAALEPGETVTHILVTHTHSDHSPASGPLSERTGAPTYGFGPHGEVRAVDPDDKVDFSAYISDDERKRYEKEWEDLPDELKREGPDTDFFPAQKLNDGDVLEAESWALIAHHTPGHCSNHVCFELPQEKTLFSGDHVMGWATSVVGPPDGSMSDYLDSLRKLLPLDVDQYLPTHGPAIPNPREYVGSFIEHREDREKQILSYLAKGPHKIADFIPDMYAAYDKRLWYPAAGSVHAHLLHMIETGRAAVVDGDDPKLTATYGLG